MSADTSFPDIPAAVVGLDATDRSVSMTIDAELYPLQAVYGAAYIFIDRCFVFIHRPQPGQYRITLAAKQDVAEPEACARWSASSPTSCSRARGGTRSRRTTAWRSRP
ncbi:MAG: hypothetical protein HC927_07680 [Deltaproteobacteria bacterium]|nr:hypothetical protein [Deltaproteobacteria bacterium]